MKSRSWRLVSFGAFLVLTSADTAAYSQQGSLVDVFPLKPSLHCLYQYKHQYHSWIYGDYYDAVDSGTIEYVVLDSSQVDDTTITWNISEHRQLVHHLVHNVPVLDTTYSTSDSVTTPLIESTTGHHELTGRFLIWEFPLRLQFGDTNHIDRYGDSSQLLLTGSASLCVMMVPPFTTNSASFSSDSGLIVMKKYFCFEDDPNGSYDRAEAELISRNVTRVKDESRQPSEFNLHQNYPNPFNPSTAIQYELPQAGLVTLRVYDILGREIATLVNENQPPGQYHRIFDAVNLSSGMYYYRLNAGNYSKTKMMSVVK